MEEEQSDGRRKGEDVIVFEDVTEVRKMKERSERDERLRAMGEMAARIAHEIKNPLGSMQLYLSMIAKGKMGDKEKGFIDSVIFGVNTIDRIINNLLSYTRPKTVVLRGGVPFPRLQGSDRFHERLYRKQGHRHKILRAPMTTFPYSIRTSSSFPS